MLANSTFKDLPCLTKLNFASITDIISFQHIFHFNVGRNEIEWNLKVKNIENMIYILLDYIFLSSIHVYFLAITETLNTKNCMYKYFIPCVCTVLI